MAKDDEEFDPWQLTSGLVDDCDVAFKDCVFGYRSDYNDGQTLLFMSDALIDGDDGPEESELIFPCGNGWDQADKGARAVREDGKRKGFNQNSGYGLLVSAALALPGVGDIMRERGTPMDAAIWNGLVFHMKRKKISYGGEIGDKERLLPVEFKGVAGEGGSKPQAGSAPSTGGTKADSAAAEKPGNGATAATGTAAPAQTAAAGDSNGALPAKLKIALRKLAGEIKGAGGTHDDFIEKAFEVEGVDGNGAAEDAIMQSGEESVWAKAGG